MLGEAARGGCIGSPAALQPISHHRVLEVPKWVLSDAVRLPCHCGDGRGGRGAIDQAAAKREKGSGVMSVQAGGGSILRGSQPLLGKKMGGLTTHGGAQTWCGWECWSSAHPAPLFFMGRQLLGTLQVSPLLRSALSETGTQFQNFWGVGTYCLTPCPWGARQPACGGQEYGRPPCPPSARCLPHQSLFLGA